MVDIAQITQQAQQMSAQNGQSPEQNAYSILRNVYGMTNAQMDGLWGFAPGSVDQVFGKQDGGGVSVGGQTSAPANPAFNPAGMTPTWGQNSMGEPVQTGWAKPIGGGANQNYDMSGKDLGQSAYKGTDGSLGGMLSSALQDPNFQVGAALTGAGLYGLGAFGGGAATAGTGAGGSIYGLGGGSGTLGAASAGSTGAAMSGGGLGLSSATGTGATLGSASAAGTAAALGGTTLANELTSVGGGKVLDAAGLLGTAKAYAPLIGAAVGALGSKDSSTSTSADKSPWAPAQPWMQANLGFAQQLQQGYQRNPFSQFQKSAYNNSVGLGNAFRNNVNSMIPQFNAWKPYQRTPQSQTVSPLQFQQPNLGLTQNLGFA